MTKFWKWKSHKIINQENQEEAIVRELRLEGEISDSTWFGDEVTPQLFREELMSSQGDITVVINSPGGDVFAGNCIYNMLMSYQGNVTVKIDSLAASAASVIAMAGTKVIMSPVAMMMCHNPSTFAFGEKVDMEKAIAMLDEVKEGIINAYELKTGLSRTKLAKMMDAETWMNAKKAVEFGFADEVAGESNQVVALNFSRKKATELLMTTVTNCCQKDIPTENKVTADSLEERLFLLKTWKS